MKHLIVICLIALSYHTFGQNKIKIPNFEESIPFKVELIRDTSFIIDCEDPHDVFYAPIIGYQECCDGEIVTINSYYQKDDKSPIIHMFELKNVVRKNFRSPAFHQGIYWYTFETSLCHTTVKMIWKCSQANFPFVYKQCVD